MVQRPAQGVSGDVMDQEVQRLFGQQKAAPEAEAAGKRRMKMEDFTNPDSPVWNNVEYGDTETQTAITRTVHREMVDAGKIVKIPDSTIQKTAGAYPDLRSMKKGERAPILRQKMDVLKISLRRVLDGLKETEFEFEVNGNVLEARLYNTGIREVMDKINQDKASMLYHSDEIFKNARYLYSTPDYDSDPNVYRWNYFYTPVQIGNGVVGVRIAVRDVVKGTDLKPESQIYNWGIKKEAALGGGRRGPKVASPGASSAASIEGTRPLNSGYTISHGPNSVKRRDPLMDAILGRKRVEHTSLSPEQFDALAARDDLAIDTAGNYSPASRSIWFSIARAINPLTLSPRLSA